MVADADEVKANWDQIKDGERGEPRHSALDGIPPGMPGLERAAKVQRRAADVGFDWSAARPVFDKLLEEIEELDAVLGNDRRMAEELGDVMFTVVNLARHLEIDPEMALRGAIDRFTSRFAAMEEMGPLDGLGLVELDARWDRAKAADA